MELIIAILIYLGLILPGTYTPQQVNAIVGSNQQSVQTVQNNPAVTPILPQYNPSQTGIIIQDDMDGDEN